MYSRSFGMAIFILSGTYEFDYKQTKQYVLSAYKHKF